MLPVFFFISGFCSLLYQIVWLRLAMGYFGMIAPILSTVLSVFMLGLGLGAWVSGWWLSSRRAMRLPSSFLLALYGGCEGVAALSALAVPRLFETFDADVSGGMGSGLYFASSALVILASLIVPCVALGATTPTALAYVRASGWDPTYRFSWLYLANLLGALAGAALTPFILIEVWGFHKTLSLGIFLQALIGIGALTLSLKKSGVSPPVESPVPEATPSAPMAAKLALAALFITGFVSMGCEVIWTRLFTPVLGTTIYAFAGILAVYLAMNALGVGLYRVWGRSTRGSLQTWLLGGLPFAALMPVYISRSVTNTTPYGVFGSLILFCILLGWLTPGWVDRYSHGDPRRAGTAYGLNILGCVFGPLCAGYFLLPHMGAKGSLILFAVALGLMVIAAIVSYSRPQACGAALFSLLSIAVASRCQSLEVPSSREAVVRRDYVATVVSTGQGLHKRLFVNGIGITVLTPLTKMMVHLPVLAHTGTPRKALVICFGMGTAFRSLCSWNLDTTAVELVPSVRDAFGYYFDDAAGVLRNAHRRIIIDDGRRFLKRTQERYDIITLDPPPPVEAAASGLLYSREFYDVVKHHLAPDGVLQQWWPGGETVMLQSVARTFVEAFPYVRVYKGLGGLGFHFLGSLTPLRPLTAQDAQRMPGDAQRDFKEWTTGYSTAALWREVIAHEIPPRELLRGDIPALTDDHPFNEYFFLRRRKARLNGVYQSVL